MPFSARASCRRSGFFAVLPMPVSLSNWKTGWLLKALVVLTLLFSIVTVTIPLDSFYYAPDFPKERLLFLSTTGFFFYVGIMSCLVIALVNFETTLANASPDSLGKIKFKIIGLGDHSCRTDLLLQPGDFIPYAQHELCGTPLLSSISLPRP